MVKEKFLNARIWRRFEEDHRRIMRDCPFCGQSGLLYRRIKTMYIDYRQVYCSACGKVVAKI